MASITLKNVPDSVLGQLRARAALSRRSLQKELLVLIETGLATVARQGTRAGESTPTYGVEEGTPRAERRQLQVEMWRALSGTWESDESLEEEIEAIYWSRSLGREVDL